MTKLNIELGFQTCLLSLSHYHTHKDSLASNIGNIYLLYVWRTWTLYLNLNVHIYVHNYTAHFTIKIFSEQADSQGKTPFKQVETLIRTRLIKRSLPADSQQEEKIDRTEKERERGTYMQ